MFSILQATLPDSFPLPTAASKQGNSNPERDEGNGSYGLK
jgi:hypothetical protein